MDIHSDTLSVETQAWRHVRAALDLAVPGWNQEAGPEPTTTAGPLASAAIERLANAADDLLDLQHHIRQEMGTIRFVLGQEGLPDLVRKELQAHLMRLARLV